MDIIIQGPGVAAQHCYIENRSGVITLHPCGNLCAVDGLQVTKPVRLSQGRSPLQHVPWCTLLIWMVSVVFGYSAEFLLSAVPVCMIPAKPVINSSALYPFDENAARELMSLLKNAQLLIEQCEVSCVDNITGGALLCSGIGIHTFFSKNVLLPPLVTMTLHSAVL